MFLVSDALAQSATSGGSGGGISSLIPIVLIVIAFYLVIIKPQNKALKLKRSMQEGLSKGDEVLTASGIIGTIKKTDAEKDSCLIQIAEGVTVTMQLSKIEELRNPKPANDSTKKK